MNQHYQNAYPALKQIGVETLNPMQLKTLEAFGQRDELLLLSPTGSGKTLAFLLACASVLETGKAGVQALVITPSRELALQIEGVFRSLQTGFKVNCFYGGHAIKTERNSLLEPPALLIGTPGRLDDHLRRGTLDLGGVKVLVLDEFDKSLQLGFQKEMAAILQQLPALKKRLLISATDMPVLPDFVAMPNALRLDFLSREAGETQLEIRRILIPRDEKPEALVRLICSYPDDSVLVFFNHREAVERIGAMLQAHGIAYGAYHGGLDQDERERVLFRFRNGSCRVLLTTDLASRGLDVPQVRLIVHYQMPLDQTAYTHRNGRTARMFASGMAYLIQAQGDTLPTYISGEVEEAYLSENPVLPDAPLWETLYINKGKKDKINKIDIVGFLCKTGGLPKEEVGLIEVKDYSAMVAVRNAKVADLLKRLRDQKLKNQKVRIAICQ